MRPTKKKDFPDHIWILNIGHTLLPLQQLFWLNVNTLSITALSLNNFTSIKTKLNTVRSVVQINHTCSYATLLHVVFKIESLLNSIQQNTALYSIF